MVQSILQIDKNELNEVTAADKLEELRRLFAYSTTINSFRINLLINY